MKRIIILGAMALVVYGWLSVQANHLTIKPDYSNNTPITQQEIDRAYSSGGLVPIPSPVNLRFETGKRLQGGYNIAPSMTSAFWLQGSRNRPLPVITIQSEMSDYIWQPTAEL